MIFTFQQINSTKRVLLYALDKEEAFSEMIRRYGTETASEYSLIAFMEAKNFNLTLN